MGPGKFVLTIALPAVLAGLVLPGRYLAAQTTSGDGGDRPHMAHRSQASHDYGLPSDNGTPVTTKPPSPETLVASGLYLPNQGRLWALDLFAGRPELVHLKYAVVQVKRHQASNILKTQATPLIYKPKQTLEIDGAASSTRLHDKLAAFYVRQIAPEENEAEEQSSSMGNDASLFLVRLKPESGRRLVLTMAFTQITGNAKRPDDVVETEETELAGTSWSKLTPKEPLAPGEYAFITLPQEQNEFGRAIYDFAVDESAPENADVLTASTSSPSAK